MPDVAQQEKSRLNGRIFHVLVVERNDLYRRAIASALRGATIHVLDTRTVDDFLDLGSKLSANTVVLELDARTPHSLDGVRLLRTHFGEGPGTSIVAILNPSMKGATSLHLHSGVDAHMPRRIDPSEMAKDIRNFVHRQIERIEGEYARWPNILDGD